MVNKIVCLFLGWLICLQVVALPPQNKLEQVNKQIDKLQKVINQEKTHSLILKNNLEQHHLSLKNIEKRLSDQREVVKVKQQKILNYHRSIRENQQDFFSSKNQLNDRLRDWYLRPKNSLWLSGDKRVLEDLYTIYFRNWFNQQQRSLTEKVDVLVQNQDLVEKVIKQRNKIAKHLDFTEKNHLQLKKVTEQNKITLEQLDRNLKIKQANLKQLLIEKRKLEKLIADLVKETARTNLSSFSAYWPGEGKVIVKFGSKIQDTQWQNNNLIIQMKHRKFSAVAPGKVIFAGPLKGYGLLLILDHQNGFVSIYGNACKLYKLTGCQVDQQEKLGEIIDQNGQYNLYFAIKKNGKAIDPEKIFIKKY